MFHVGIVTFLHWGQKRVNELLELAVCHCLFICLFVYLRAVTVFTCVADTPPLCGPE